MSGEPVALLAGIEPEPSVQPLVDLVSLVGGRFRMGSPEDEIGRDGDEGPVPEVRISPFACMRFPVTRRIYAEVMGNDPGSPEGMADERPVNNVTWFDAVRFCNRLSEREGLSACYRIDRVKVSWDGTADGYRLLTEAEWEYACRAGTQTRWSFGEDESLLAQYAWFAENSDGKPQPVGKLQPNPFGLYDMHGNVWEWCWDWYGPYRKRERTDLVGPQEGNRRMLRGGSFNYLTPRFLRSACRDSFEPSDRNEFIGFRCGRGSRHQL